MRVEGGGSIIPHDLFQRVSYLLLNPTLQNFRLTAMGARSAGVKRPGTYTLVVDCDTSSMKVSERSISGYFLPLSLIHI